MIYLDHSATTPVRPEVLAFINDTLASCYGNPSSLYDLGIASEKVIKESRRTIAKTLRVKEDEIFFTSCGSESNNTVLRGVAEAYRKRGDRIICSAVEHPSVLRTMEYLSEEQGFQLTKIGVDRRGHFDLEGLKKAMTEDTILVSVMMVNNEVGSVFPLKEIADIVHGINPDCVFHVDGVQGYGRIPIDLKKTGIDAFSLSGHKLGAPKGIGALYLRSGLRVKPLIYGGGQEKGLRSGTENTAYIGALGLAAKLCLENREEKNRYLQEVKDTLIAELRDAGIAFEINGDLENGAAHIVNLRFDGVKSEVLLHYLEGQKDTGINDL
ncbi:MAG: cysteine desulfurase, partial [Firmicutes bacterium]|nr:cysteine desulfurase [Bacillota bacterium]